MADQICSGAGCVAEYYEWFEESKQGDRLQYHLGDLMYDRNVEHFPLASTERKRDIEALHALALRILADVKDRKVHAFQRRVHDGISEYIVEKR